MLMSLVCATMILGTTGCSKSISKITTNDLQMNVDESKEISITVEPEGMDTKDVTCKISDESIAKLDGLKVTGLKEGNTTYVCSSKKVESESKITITMTEEQKKAKEEADRIAKEQAEARAAEEAAKREAKAAEDAAKKEAADRIANATIGQKNALQSAKDYLNYTAFSYNGLVEQLEYEGYSNEEAIFAVDNCGANWNEQAAKSAKQYLDYSSFSRAGLIEQLIYEGFSQEQAEYGVTQAGY